MRPLRLRALARCMTPASASTGVGAGVHWWEPRDCEARSSGRVSTYKAAGGGRRRWRSCCNRAEGHRTRAAAGGGTNRARAGARHSRACRRHRRPRAAKWRRGRVSAGWRSHGGATPYRARVLLTPSSAPARACSRSNSSDAAGASTSGDTAGPLQQNSARSSRPAIADRRDVGTEKGARGWVRPPLSSAPHSRPSAQRHASFPQRRQSRRALSGEARPVVPTCAAPPSPPWRHPRNRSRNTRRARIRRLVQARGSRFASRASAPGAAPAQPRPTTFSAACRHVAAAAAAAAPSAGDHVQSAVATATAFASRAPRGAHSTRACKTKTT